jgi:predicted PurR-regulated permease PerM
LLDFAVFEILGTGWFFDSECFWNIENWQIFHFFWNTQYQWFFAKIKEAHNTGSLLFIYMGASHVQKTRGFFCSPILSTLSWIHCFPFMSFCSSLIFFILFSFFVLRRDKKVACLVWNRTCLLHRDLRKKF